LADTQPAPLPVEPGSITEAQSAFLGLLEPEEVKPETEESTPEEVEESTEETQDESPEEVSEEEPEEESEDESEEDSDEESDVEEEVEELYTVTVNGEEHQVPLEELVKGYSRHSDYTKKTQEIAEYRRGAEAAIQQAQQEIHQTQQFRQQYIDAASAVVQERYGKWHELQNNTDWERLKIEDREEYLTKKSEQADLENSIKQETERVNQVAQQQQHEEAQAHQQYVAGERQKLESIIPEWKNQEFRSKVGKDLTEFAMSQGFSEKDVRAMTDHRHLLVLMQAKAFQEMQNAQETTKAKKTKKKPKMVSSGTGKKKGENSKKQRTAQMKRLKESGHVNDSVSLFEDFIDI
jgi:hypothetical protein